MGNRLLISICKVKFPVKKMTFVLRRDRQHIYSKLKCTSWFKQHPSSCIIIYVSAHPFSTVCPYSTLSHLETICFMFQETLQSQFISLEFIQTAQHSHKMGKVTIFGLPKQKQKTKRFPSSVNW
ncbi:UNVERIFIED_CONTAM: hypothetical protein K2H54_022939 [Gekko kuhli]